MTGRPFSLVCVLFYSITFFQCVKFIFQWSKKGHKKGQFEPAEVRKLFAKNFSITVQWTESKKYIVFTSGDGKNHEWRRPRVVFGVPTVENNVFAVLKQAQ
jgi:hypothetical protein